jgi:hypothetical protein
LDAADEDRSDEPTLQEYFERTVAAYGTSDSVLSSFTTADVVRVIREDRASH